MARELAATLATNSRSVVRRLEAAWIRPVVESSSAAGINRESPGAGCGGPCHHVHRRYCQQ